MADRYEPTAIEPKWQARWAERGTNETDLDGATKPVYNLMMFPYPSAEGLHIGNVYAFTGVDIHARFQEMKTHPLFADLLAGGKAISYGAKTIPEGGWFAMPRLVADGALIADIKEFVTVAQPQLTVKQHGMV